MESVSGAFQDRILNYFLPEFCNDPTRSWGAEGFAADWHKINERDAADFLRGFEGELLQHQGRGLYRAARSYASEQLFWSGSKQKSPRSITLWLEPIITVAVLARLHFDLGWPKEMIGTQSKDWAFDAAAYLPDNSDVEYIACEVKKSVAELGRLIELMNRFGTNPRGDAKNGQEKNALKKIQALRTRRPPLFWAVGPGGTSNAFRLRYMEHGVIGFQEIGVQELGYSTTGTDQV